MFGKCLKWVFQVIFKRFPVGRDSLEDKKIIKVKFLWIIAATAGRFYEWESVFLEKHPRYVFRDTLSLVAAPKCFHIDFLCLYSSQRWQSVSWDNWDSLHLSLKLSFLTKPTYAKFCNSFNESHFQAKITTSYYWFYWFWPPRLKLTLPWWGGFPPRIFKPSASKRRAQLSVAAKVVRPTDPLKNVRYWFIID